MVTTADTLRRTNERPGTRAKLSNLRTSAYKVREVLDLIRGQDVQRASEILRFSQRGPSEPIGKLLESAAANALQNDGIDRSELFVSACFADEGPTMKRMRPRAKGRADRINKRTSHITIVVSRLPQERLDRLQEQQAEERATRRNRVSGSRAARVAKSRQSEGAETTPASDEAPDTATEDAATTPVAEETSAPEVTTATTEPESEGAEASAEPETENKEGK